MASALVRSGGDVVDLDEPEPVGLGRRLERGPGFERAIGRVVGGGSGRIVFAPAVVRAPRFTFRGIAAKTPASITVAALDSHRRGVRISLHVPPAEHRRKSR